MITKKEIADIIEYKMMYKSKQLQNWDRRFSEGAAQAILEAIQTATEENDIKIEKAENAISEVFGDEADETRKNLYELIGYIQTMISTIE